tara:strand:- start:117 stop:737 length:621 start_codon:yes stop_codon:yes gene_type:complete
MKHNPFKILLDLYFPSKKIIIINILLFSLLILIFSILQFYQFKKGNKIYKHSLTFYNIPYVRNGGVESFFRDEKIDITIQLIEEYQISDMNVFNIFARKYSNSNKKSEEFKSILNKFINRNLESSKKITQSKINYMKKFDNTIYYTPGTIYKLETKLENLEYNGRKTYTITSNFSLISVLGNSLILSVFITTLLRLFMIELKPKKN